MTDTEEVEKYLLHTQLNFKVACDALSISEVGTLSIGQCSSCDYWDRLKRLKQDKHGDVLCSICYGFMS